MARLERRPGQREERWAHLLAGEISEKMLASIEEGGESRRATTSTRLAALEAQVAALSGELGEVKAALERLSGLLD